MRTMVTTEPPPVPIDRLVCHLRQPLPLSYRCGVCGQCFPTQADCGHVMSHIEYQIQPKLSHTEKSTVINDDTTSNVDLTKSQYNISPTVHTEKVQNKSRPWNLENVAQGTNKEQNAVSKANNFELNNGSIDHFADDMSVEDIRKLVFGSNTDSYSLNEEVDIKIDDLETSNSSDITVKSEEDYSPENDSGSIKTENDHKKGRLSAIMKEFMQC